MSSTRREAMKAVAIGGAAMTAGTAGAAQKRAKPQLLHQVFFWLKRSGSKEDRDKLAVGLRSLAKIKAIRSLQIGVPASTEKRDVVDSSFDLSELMIFDNAADQKTYQDHPIHQAFVANYGHLWRKVVVYDSMTL